MSNDEPFSTPELNNAVKARNKSRVKRLLKAGADIDGADWDGDTALHVDAQFSETGITEILLKAGIMVNTRDKDGNTALSIVLGRNDKAKARFLIAHGAKDTNMSDLMVSNRSGKLMVEKSQDVIADLLENATVPVKERPA